MIRGSLWYSQQSRGVHWPPIVSYCTACRFPGWVYVSKQLWCHTGKILSEWLVYANNNIIHIILTALTSVCRLCSDLSSLVFISCSSFFTDSNSYLALLSSLSILFILIFALAWNFFGSLLPPWCCADLSGWINETATSIKMWNKNLQEKQMQLFLLTYIRNIRKCT